MKTLSAKKVDELSQSDADILLMDVLPESSYAKQHIPSAISNPVESDDFVRRTRELVDSMDDVIVVYCADADCPLSEQAAHALEDAGFENVIDMEGGIEQWKASGLPVES